MKTLILAFILSMSIAAQASITSFSYSGRLLDSNDAAVTQKFLTFQIKLKKGECTIYQEYLPEDLSNSGGYFSLDVGTGSSATGLFSNLYTSGNVQDINGQNCNILPTDVAYMNIVVSGLSGNQTIDFGWVQLKNGYQGLNSQKLQGKQASEFINVTPVVTQSAIETLLNSGILDNQGNLSVYTRSSIDTQIGTVNTSLQNTATKDFSNVTTIPGSKVTGQIPVAAVPDISATYATRSSLSTVATSGAYSSLTGRPTNLSQFTNDAGFVSSFSLPNIDWSKITGRPTTADGYGISDVVKNGGGVGSLQSGPDSSKPTLSATGNIYFATDTQKTYYYNGASWNLIGSVAGLSSLSVASPLGSSGGTTPTLTINKASTTNDGYLSFSDWNLFNNKTSSSLAAGKIYVGNSAGVATPFTLSGDVDLTSSGVTSVRKIQGSDVNSNAPALNQMFKYNGTTWGPGYTNISDIRSSLIPTSDFFPTNCTAGQVMIYSSITDTMNCSSIAISGAQVTFINQQPNAVLIGPNGASGTAVFRNLVEDDLPSINWSKLLNVPTTVSTLGLTDAVTNSGGAPSIRSGLNASKPASDVTGALYVSSDTFEIYQFNGTVWTLIATKTGSGGTISQITGDVSASGSGNVLGTVNFVGSVSAANVAAGATLANGALSGNGASTLVRRDASGNFAASAITQTSSIYKDNGTNSVTIQAPSSVSGSYSIKLPTSVGATNTVLGTIDSSGSLGWINPSGIINVNSPITNAGSTIGITQSTSSTAGYLSAADWNTFNNKLSSALNPNYILVGSAGSVATGVPLTGDISITSAGLSKVAKIQNTTVSATAPTTSGQILKYNGTEWFPNYIGIADIRSSMAGSAQFFPINCNAGQTFSYSAVNDKFNCVDISFSASSVDLTTDQTVAGNKTFTGKVAAKLITGTVVSGSTATVDLSGGNTFTSSYNCAAAMNFGSSMIDGASYNVIVTDPGTTQCTFTATGVTLFKFVPANAARTASSHTVYSMLRAGSTVYVWWTSGF